MTLVNTNIITTTVRRYYDRATTTQHGPNSAEPVRQYRAEHAAFMRHEHEHREAQRASPQGGGYSSHAGALAAGAENIQPVRILGTRRDEDVACAQCDRGADQDAVWSVLMSCHEHPPPAHDQLSMKPLATT